MNELYTTNRFRFYSRFIYSIIVMAIVIALLFVVFSHTNASFYNVTARDYSDMWTYDSGSVVDFEHLIPDEHFSIHKRADAELIKNNSLCFYSKNIYFTVYLGNTIIYDFHPISPDFFGKAYGVYPHSVSIPVTGENENIYIKIDNIYKGTPGYMKNLSLDAASRFMVTRLQSSAYEFIFCLLVFVFGIVLVSIGFIGRYFGDNRFEIISMGTFAMITAVWIMSETQMLPILTGSPVAVHFMDYISLDLLPLPGLIFIAFVIGYRNSVLIPIASVLTLAKLIFSFISTTSGYRDYHQLLWLSHVNLAIIAVMIIYYIIRGIVTKRIQKNLTIILTVAISLLIISGIADIIRYTIRPETFASISFFKHAIFVFILLCGVYEFMSISELSRRGQYAEIMEKLAYQDALTGLFNRQAFNQEVDRIKTGSTCYTFIMMDMNNLKIVNDRFGHNNGDLYIKSMADIISTSFMQCGKCFRIGGDEFFIMMDKSLKDADFSGNMSRLHKRIELFNEEHQDMIPMSTAYGCADYDPTKDDVDERIKYADTEMYSMKTEMKSKMEN